MQALFKHKPKHIHPKIKWLKALIVQESVKSSQITPKIIAVPQVTGGPPTQGAEECRCPPGYRGFSCEECSVGHYRESEPLGQCVKCPCNDNEQACGLGQSGRVECLSLIHI